MQNFWMYLLVVVVTCLTPGAGVLMTLNNALRYGKANAFVSPLGNAFGGLTMAVICATGLGALHCRTATFRGPRSPVFRAAPPYSHLREKTC